MRQRMFVWGWGWAFVSWLVGEGFCGGMGEYTNQVSLGRSACRTDAQIGKEESEDEYAHCEDVFVVSTVVGLSCLLGAGGLPACLGIS